MKRIAIGFSIILLAAAPALSQAETHHEMQMAQAGKQTGSGQGTVNRVDLQNNKVNMTHGPIQSLGWPGMTMDFKVKDAAVLHGIKPGQKVTFEVVKEGPKQYFVTRINPQQ